MIVRYFAYGSNMSEARFREHGRCPTAKTLSKAWADGWRLVFDKQSSTWKGTAANLRPDPEDVVWGVLYDISSPSEIERLRRGESGYAARDVGVTSPSGEREVATTFLAAQGVEHPPTAAYLDCMIQGAQQHGLPPEYVARLRSIPVAREGTR